MKIIQATSLTVALLLRIIVPKGSNMMLAELSNVIKIIQI